MGGQEIKSGIAFVTPGDIPLIVAIEQSQTPANKRRHHRAQIILSGSFGRRGRIGGLRQLPLIAYLAVPLHGLLRGGWRRTRRLETPFLIDRRFLQLRDIEARVKIRR